MRLSVTALPSFMQQWLSRLPDSRPSPEAEVTIHTSTETVVCGSRAAGGVRMGRGHWPGCSQRSCSTNARARVWRRRCSRAMDRCAPRRICGLPLVHSTSGRGRAGCSSTTISVSARTALYEIRSPSPCAEGVRAGTHAGACRVGAPPRPAGAASERVVLSELAYYLPACGVPERRKSPAAPALAHRAGAHVPATAGVPATLKRGQLQPFQFFLKRRSALRNPGAAASAHASHR